MAANQYFDGGSNLLMYGVQGAVGDDGSKGFKGQKGESNTVACDHTNAVPIRICECSTPSGTYGKDGSEEWTLSTYGSTPVLASKTGFSSTTKGKKYLQTKKRGCWSSIDNDPSTYWRAKRDNLGTEVTYKFCDDAVFHVLSGEFEYLDAMSDRTGSVTVTNIGTTAEEAEHKFEMFDSGIVQQRHADWGEHSQIKGNGVTITASGGNPWRDGKNFGARSVKFWGCKATN